MQQSQNYTPNFTQSTLRTSPPQPLTTTTTTTASPSTSTPTPTIQNSQAILTNNNNTNSTSKTVNNNTTNTNNKKPKRNLELRKQVRTRLKNIQRTKQGWFYGHKVLKSLGGSSTKLRIISRAMEMYPKIYNVYRDIYQHKPAQIKTSFGLFLLQRKHVNYDRSTRLYSLKGGHGSTNNTKTGNSNSNNDNENENEKQESNFENLTIQNNQNRISRKDLQKMAFDYWEKEKANQEPFKHKTRRKLLKYYVENLVGEVRKGWEYTCCALERLGTPASSWEIVVDVVRHERAIWNCYVLVYCEKEKVKNFNRILRNFRSFLLAEARKFFMFDPIKRLYWIDPNKFPHSKNLKLTSHKNKAKNNGTNTTTTNNKENGKGNKEKQREREMGLENEKDELNQNQNKNSNSKIKTNQKIIKN